MTKHIKRLILSALQDHRGDNLERATARFSGLSPEAMQQQYGQSGETRQAILDGYREHVATVMTAIQEIESLPVSD